jgi:CheY-like chemotaxis protein
MKTILVVDDDPDIRVTLRELLELEGYRILEAESGVAAFEILKAPGAQPSIVVLDNMMPEMSGPELLDALGDERRSQLRVILISAHQTPPDSRANAFLRKPFELDALLSVLREPLG